MNTNNLLKFRVRNFRSVNDSGWIANEEITCLVGINEAGKTNLLLPLWKLNPANGEDIIPLSDYPRSKYADYNSTEGKEVFISAEFNISDEFAQEIADIEYWDKDTLKVVRVHRKFNSEYEIEFPNSKIEKIETEIFLSWLPEIEEKTSEDDNTNKVIDILHQTVEEIKKNKEITQELISKLLVNLKIDIEDNQTTSTHKEFIETCEKVQDSLQEDELVTDEELNKMVLAYIPSFIYFSDYGSLDAEIYLPDVINQLNTLKQQKLTENKVTDKANAKARTLKVLFEFVNLEPNEILALGQEHQNRNPQHIIEETKKKEVFCFILHHQNSQKNLKSGGNRGTIISDLKLTEITLKFGLMMVEEKIG